MKSFDLLLVVAYFRSATAYLSIVRHLSRDLRIGVLIIDADPSLMEKTGSAHALFMKLCTEFGAEVVDLSGQIQSRLALVQQFPYSDDVVAHIRENLTVEKYIGMMTLASAGLEQHDRYLKQFGISKVFAPSRRLMEFLVARRQATERYQCIDVEEVGLPYRRYPVFTDFAVDWIIAAPTLFSFRSETGKHGFLRMVIALLDSIPPSEVVAYKPHNGNNLDYFAPRYHYFLARLIYRLRGSVVALNALSNILPRQLRVHVERVLTGVLHLKVLRRAIQMRDLTPYSDISLEAFLPGVRKGVIGGLSNTIWGTLYFDLPFYNCVDPSLRCSTPELANKSSVNLLDVNLEYFGVPFCSGDITKGVNGVGIIFSSEVSADLLHAVKRNL